jgi:Holliday junction resolvase RusA-like endonuclease
VAGGIEMKFDIPGRLPGLNEMIDAAKQGEGKYQPYARMKDDNTNLVAWLAKKLPAYNCVSLVITWYEPNAKRDIDNITAGTKFILDGLVRAKTIPNDTQKYVKGIQHHFEIDRKNARIEVEIQEQG